MGQLPEKVFPFRDSGLEDPQTLPPGARAMKDLVNHFRSGLPGTIEATMGANRAMNIALASYRNLYDQAGIDGLRGEKRDDFLMEGLVQDGVITDTDPIKAFTVFKIISRGYELNSKYFNRKFDLEAARSSA